MDHVNFREFMVTNTKEAFNITSLTLAQKNTNLKNDRWRFCKSLDNFNVCPWIYRRQVTSAHQCPDIIFRSTSAHQSPDVKLRRPNRSPTLNYVGPSQPRR